MKKLILIFSLVMLFTSTAHSQRIEVKDVQEFYDLVVVKAALLPIQAEMNDKEKPPKPEAAAAYDKAAKAFNKARESLQLLETAKKLGEGEAKTRKQFQDDLAKAKEIVGQYFLGRGVLP